MKIAIIHDYLNQYGGAEKVIEVLFELFPDAPIYTSIYDQAKLPPVFKSMDIRTSYMQKLPFLGKHFKKYLLLYPGAIERFDLSEYDLILSSSSAFAKGAIKRNDASHICYCYTPMRFVWEYESYIEKENFSRLESRILTSMIKKLKDWDLKTAGRVDYYVAISDYVKDKIKKSYNRDAEVIYRPVNTGDFKVSNTIEDYFLIVSRLNAYKNIDMVIRVFNELGLNLRIIGDGPYRKILQDMAKNKNIEFLGKVDYEVLKEAYGKYRAYIFPGKEDFGITPVEAQSSGRPVIAFAQGGALETVADGVTVLFFNENTEISLAEAVKKFLKLEDSFEKNKILENAKRFDTEIFKTRIMNFISNNS